MGVPDDITALDNQFDAAERDARSVAAGLSEQEGQGRTSPDSWSVAQCLAHLAIANRTYLAAMGPAAERATAQGRERRGPATPGVLGRWFIRSLEPPVKPRWRGKAPKVIRPQDNPTLAEALADFLESQEQMRAFLRRVANLDLARISFPNPFVKWIRFSLATGLNVIAAHERRHIWQARQVRATLKSER